MRNTWAVYKIDRPDRRGDLDARLEPEQLQDGARHADRVPARRGRTARRHRSRCSTTAAARPRSIRPGVELAVLTRRNDDRDADQAVRAHPGARHQLRGRRPGAAQRRPVRRLGAAAVLHRVQLGRTGGVRRPLHLEHLELPRLQVELERPAADAAERCRRAQQRRDDRALGELERRHHRVVVAGAGGYRAPSTLSDAADAPKERIRDRRSRRPPGWPTSRCRRSARTAACSATSPMATARPHIGIAGRTAFVSGGGTGGSSRRVRQRPGVPHRGHAHRRVARWSPAPAPSRSRRTAAGSSTSR